MKHPFVITLSELPTYLVLAITYVGGVGVAAFVFVIRRVWRAPRTGWQHPKKASSADALY